MKDADDKPRVVYDGECPICRAFVNNIEIEGGMETIDGRNDTPERELVTGSGCSLDEGVAVIDRGQVFHGKAAVNYLARRAKKNSLMNLFTRVSFGGPVRARIMYPVVKAMRNALLWMLGREKIGR